MSVEEQKEKIENECKKCTEPKEFPRICFDCLKRKLSIVIEIKEQYKALINAKEYSSK